MAWRPWFLMICGGPESRHGSRGSGSFAHGRVGLGSSDIEVAGITSAMVGEENSYFTHDEESEGRPFQVRARAVRLNQSPRGGGRGGRTGRGGRGRTGTTAEVPATVADTGRARGMAHESSFLLTRTGPSTCGRLGHFPSFHVGCGSVACEGKRLSAFNLTTATVSAV